jgi:hypothetical protein
MKIVLANAGTTMSKIEINRNAAVWASDKVFIAAPLDLVWSVQTGLTKWTEWNPDVSEMALKGPLVPGTEFCWKAGGMTIVSELQRK